MIWQNDFNILNKIKAESDIVEKNSKLKYYNIPCSFDIETSSFYEGDEKRACMYLWACCL